MVMNTINVQLFEVLGTGGDSSFSGVIAGGQASTSFDPNGGGRLRKSGNSRLTLSGNNTYSNRTFVSDGSQIRVQSNTALGSTAINTDAFTTSGGAYELDNGAGLTIDKAFRLNGTGTSDQGAILNLTGNNEIIREVQIGWNGGSTVASAASIGVSNGTTLTLSDVIEGDEDLSKVGLGTLTFSGTSSNTHMGTTIVEGGVLLLDKTGADAIANLLDVKTAGTARLVQSDQIPDTAGVRIDGGIFDMDGLPESMGSLEFYSGTLNQGGALLSLAETGTALTMRNATTTGSIALTGGAGGEVRFDATDNGTGTIASLTTGAPSRTFNIDNGIAATDLLLQASSGGSFVKEGAGRLELSGTHSHGGSTVTVNNGQLAVTGTLTTDATAVSSGGTLMGTGVVDAPVNTSGRIAPGLSIGTLTVAGDVTFSSGSVYEVEVNPTESDLLISSTGNIQIDSGATLDIIHEAGMYPPTFSYLIISAPTGTVTGTFDTVQSTLPLFLDTVLYQSNAVFLEQAVLPFSDVVTAGNGARVAQCLDEITPAPGSDLESIYEVLQCCSNLEFLESALNQMQPSLLKNMALSQQNNLVKVRSAITQRLNSAYQTPCSLQARRSKLNLWVSAGGNYFQQNERFDNPESHTKTFTTLLGVDGTPATNVHLGATGAFSCSDIKWKESAGNGSIYAGSGSLFAGYDHARFFIDGCLSGAYNYYQEKRHIRFDPINRVARGNFDGWQFLSHLRLGGRIRNGRGFEVSPFAMADYITMHQDSFTERGAKSLNLDVEDSMYNLLRSEGGLSLNQCFWHYHLQYLLHLKLSYVREDRWQGQTYRANLVDTGCTFRVKGVNPTRNIFAPSLGLTITKWNSKIQISMLYDGEFSRHYRNHNGNLELIVPF